MDEHSIAVPPDSTDLHALALGINEEHRQCEAAVLVGLVHGYRAGVLLMQAKQLCSHGEWLLWLQENFEGSERSAQAYMRVAREWPRLAANPQRAADLSLRDALALLTTPSQSRTATEDKLAEGDEMLERAAAAMYRLDRRVCALEGAPATAETIIALTAVIREANEWSNRCVEVRLRAERHGVELSDELADLLRRMNIQLPAELIFTYPDHFAAMCRDALAAALNGAGQ